MIPKDSARVPIILQEFYDSVIGGILVFSERISDCPVCCFGKG